MADANCNIDSKSIERLSSVVAFPKIKRRRGRKPTRSPRCPVAHLHNPADARLMAFKFKVLADLWDSPESWAAHAIDLGDSDPVQLMVEVMTGAARHYFYDHIEEVSSRYWFCTKPTYGEEKLAMEAAQKNKQTEID